MRDPVELRAEHGGPQDGPASDEFKQEILKELRRLLESPDFRNSRRGQLLLRYLVEHTLAGKRDRIKERTIGVELFGREASYDTGQDSIVRVAANDVRKRLAEHYERARDSDDLSAIRISIPPGSYAPEFQRMEAVPPAPEVVDAAPVAGPLPELAPSAQPQRPRLRIIGYCCVVLALLCACVVLALQNRKLRSQTAGVNAPEPLPWSMLANASGQIDVVVADASFGATKEILKTDIGLPEYANQSWLEGIKPNSPALVVAKMPLTSVADAVIVARITGMLDKRGYSTVIRSGRSIQIADLKTEHPTVLLGSPNANPWVELVSDHLNFRIERDPQLGRQVCLNRSPQAGEPAVYVPTARTGSAGTAYATISLVPNLTHDAFVLILAGSNMEGTEAAGELATDLPRLTESLRQRGIDPNGKVEQLELLMRVECMTTASGRSEIVAHRVVLAANKRE